MQQSTRMDREPLKEDQQARVQQIAILLEDFTDVTNLVASVKTAKVIKERENELAKKTFNCVKSDK